VRALIQQVDQAYARGEADYRKGKLSEAKIEFDRSVDLMLMCGIPIKSDPQLQEEFDRIVAGDGSAQTGQRICAQRRTHASRCGQRCDL
jgi:hypothetical protein